MKSRAWIGWVCLGLSGLLAWPSLGFYVAPADHRPRVRRLPAGGSETNQGHGLPEHLALILDGNGRWWVRPNLYDLSSIIKCVE